VHVLRLADYGEVVTDAGGGRRLVAVEDAPVALVYERAYLVTRAPGMIDGVPRTRGRWIDGELARVVDEVNVIQATAETPMPDGGNHPDLHDAVARLPLLLARLRRGLVRLALVLLAVVGWLLARLTQAVWLPWRLTADHVPVADLSPTVPLLRAHTTLTAAPPTRPLVIAGATG
jgi:hypothetical protein